MKAAVALAVLLGSIVIAEAHAPCPCCDGRIVGRIDCHTFGDAWVPDAPGLFVELGTSWRRTTFPASPAGSAARAIAGPDGDRRIDTIGPDMRFGVELPRHFSIAAHFDAGVGDDDGLVSTGLVLAKRVHLGRLSLAAEAVGGARWFMMDARHDADGETVYEHANFTGFLDVRARAEWWFVPVMSVSAWVGSSVLDRDDVSLGFSVNVATRPFRGR